MKWESVFLLDECEFLNKIFLFISSAKPSLKPPHCALSNSLQFITLQPPRQSSGFSEFPLWTFENLPARSEGDGLA